MAHISYENASQDQLLYIDSSAKKREVVDDGYHSQDEQTQDGIDSPVWHLVGDSSSLQTQEGRVIVAYQDSTVVELRMAAAQALRPAGTVVLTRPRKASNLVIPVHFGVARRLEYGDSLVVLYREV